MKKLFVFTFVLMTFSLISSAQENSDSSSVVIPKDPRIDSLIKKQALINEETVRNARKVAKGFRLLVINTNKRDDAIAAKTKVYTYFPELKAYLIYQSPYFKLKVGNFKERKDAEDYQKKLNRFFPNGVFIMTDIIELKPEDVFSTSL
jgi:hypothetical protein